ncbi:c-type cytochrome [Pontibacterium granulatum]|uniref:c-type cytochrome n=1 Tax=Pontibacterium granulatum TaxID=2036029 RepID=UPI002499B875|nr:c-type cytochrome [Pontibacterium granulatum]MDI3323778.1 c-type cytochrome [Pontibacterium granulatum]
MKRLVIALGVTLAAAVVGWNSLPLLANVGPEQLNATTGDVARGAYLARASGCIACHTRIEDGGAPLAGGSGLETPFGTFYAPNLTTDVEHGIGGWTQEQFAVALRKGISPAGKPYYPAFPYSFYTKFSDQDIADLWAAFQTVPAVADTVSEHDLSFPFSQRNGLYLWQKVFFTEGRLDVAANREEKYRRGEYLVESAAHCAACHTPRNLLGGLKRDRDYTGSVSMLQAEGQIPAITPQALTEAGWTVKDLAWALQSGIKPDGDVFGGSMGEVVRDGTAYLQPEDLEAMAHYLMNRK